MYLGRYSANETVAQIRFTPPEVPPSYIFMDITIVNARLRKTAAILRRI
jgi:hypothetical protein